MRRVRKSAHLDGLDVVHVEAVAELVDTRRTVSMRASVSLGQSAQGRAKAGSHLVERDLLTATICVTGGSARALQGRTKRSTSYVPRCGRERSGWSA
jgi:hypothetical protein